MTVADVPVESVRHRTERVTGISASPEPLIGEGPWARDAEGVPRHGVLQPGPDVEAGGGVLTPLDSHAAIHCSVSCTRGMSLVAEVAGRRCGIVRRALQRDANMDCPSSVARPRSGPPRARIGCPLLILALASTAALGAPKTDIVVFHNGDRLTGEVKGLEAGRAAES